MRIPTIEIQTTKAFLQMTTAPSVQEIEQPKATLTQSQPAAILEMSSTKPRLSIDTTEARASIDLKSIRRRIEEHAQFGQQSALEGVGRRVEEGRQLMEIERGENALAAISKQGATPAPLPIGIQFLRGYDLVDLEVEPGAIDIQATPQRPTLEVAVNQPIHDYTPGKVQMFVDPHPAIQIDVKA